MERKFLKIEHIPAILWGKASSKVIIAIHGNLSHKSDVPIQILATIAINKGYQVLSFDLAQHGDRKEEKQPCKVQNSVEDLKIVMNYVQKQWKHISLFANSIGAYFSLLAYNHQQIEKVLFLSPVVDMQRIIENMMQWFHISQEEFKQKQIIETPIHQTLYWDYYCYVLNHPIESWNMTTYILYGNQDEMCEKEIIEQFTKQFSCHLKIVESQHYFHTSKQLQLLEEWINQIL